MARILSIILFLTLYCSVAFADWSLPITVQSGAASTSLTLAIQSGATNGFDSGKDVPSRPYEDDLLFASFPHPEWGINLGGEAVYSYSRDARGSLPQEFVFEVICKQSQATLSWNPSNLPPRTSLLLRNPTAGSSLDMATNSSYTFSPGGTSPVDLVVTVSQGDVIPPSSPSGVTVEERDGYLYVEWERSSEADLGGYKLHYGTQSGNYQRTIDVRKVTNYGLMNLKAEEYYYIALTAYDLEGNESDYSYEVSSSFGIDFDPPLSPVGLRLVATEKTLSLAWDANLETDLGGYKVYVGTGYGDYSQAFNVGKATSFNLSNPAAETTYHFAVAAFDEKDNESDLSSSVSGALKSVETTVPDVPEDDQELPTEITTSTVKVLGASAVYLQLPGEGGTDRTSSDKKEAGGERQERVAEKEKPSQEESGVVENENAPKVPEVVQGKGGEIRLNFDDHPWQLLTIPLRVSVTKPFSQFVARNAEMNKLIGWDSKAQSYQRLKYPRPGTAFWLKAGKGYAVFKGQPYREKNAVFELDKGLNLIGSPYLEAVPFKQARVKVDDQFYSLSEAIALKLLARQLQGYEAGKFVQIEIDNRGAFYPWLGYWVQALKPCELVLFDKPLPVQKAVAAKTVKDDEPLTAKK